MNLEITIAGHAASWRFRDSPALLAWLQQRPWLDTGGVRAVAVTTEDVARRLSRSILRMVRAYDDGCSNVRLGAAVRPPEADGFRLAVARALDVPDGVTGRTFGNRLAELASSTPLALAIECGAGLIIPDLDEANWFVEVVSKSATGGSLAIILVAISETGHLAGAWNYGVGGPVGSVLTYLDEEESTLWSAYLHHRVAWEGAGNGVHCEGLVATGCENASCGRDDDLESSLNSYATEAWSRVDPEVARALLNHVQGIVDGQLRSGRDTEADRLEHAGLLWRPLNAVRARPAPWVARALLLAQQRPSARDLLRSCVTCAPMAHDVLGRCFELEAQERAVCCAEPRQRHQALEPAILERAGRFKDGLSDERRFYPAGCPALPIDAFSLLSFGEFLVRFPGDPRRAAARWELRTLRNAVAHGHYVGWEVLRTLRRTQRVLLPDR